MAVLPPDIATIALAENGTIDPAGMDGLFRTIAQEMAADISAYLITVPESMELDPALFDVRIDLHGLPAGIRLVFVSPDRKMAIMLGMVFVLNPLDRKVHIVHTKEEALELLERAPSPHPPFPE
ncbi:MAG TPA: hypothetical protein VGE21_03855 [Flavobacteriales bacterium]